MASLLIASKLIRLNFCSLVCILFLPKNRKGRKKYVLYHESIKFIEGFSYLTNKDSNSQIKDF